MPLSYQTRAIEIVVEFAEVIFSLPNLDLETIENGNIVKFEIISNILNDPLSLFPSWRVDSSPLSVQSRDLFRKATRFWILAPRILLTPTIIKRTCNATDMKFFACSTNQQSILPLMRIEKDILGEAALGC
ncbi:hypothetical protein BofuT4_P046400.1 [Botrytis cinerea T4]|uniref:Uncharacterized protein n=1 Tax=Botryotinia fuckeliana (strain T4) TaxID=999810 RepID=G2XYT5_BOTF4|nr:hypothetical protein BofuT4_P046400.1 [Botrytis cinerea T4]